MIDLDAINRRCAEAEETAERAFLQDMQACAQRRAWAHLPAGYDVRKTEARRKAAKFAARQLILHKHLCNLLDKDNAEDVASFLKRFRGSIPIDSIGPDNYTPLRLSLAPEKLAKGVVGCLQFDLVLAAGASIGIPCEGGKPFCILTYLDETLGRLGDATDGVSVKIRAAIRHAAEAFGKQYPGWRELNELRQRLTVQSDVVSLRHYAQTAICRSATPQPAQTETATILAFRGKNAPAGTPERLKL